MPSRSFGSNQVDFGGITPPESATCRSAFNETGGTAKATLNFPESTNLTNSPVPRIPPTKSIRLSVRGFVIPSTGSSKLRDKMLISSDSIGSN